MTITAKNLVLGIKDQLPVKRLIKNIRSGNVVGLFSPRSHFKADGSAKVSYPTKEHAIKAAQSMQKRYDTYFSNYKCIFCDGFHLGKNKA